MALNEHRGVISVGFDSEGQAAMGQPFFSTASTIADVQNVRGGAILRGNECSLQTPRARPRR
jgi:hypothetical protein